MIARVFLSFGRCRPFPLRGLTAARRRRTRDSFFSWPRGRALSFCSFPDAILSPLHSIGMLALDGVNGLLSAGSSLKVKKVSGL
jgi:hypothetical protein